MSESLNLASIRKNYSLKELTEDSVAADPLSQLNQWLHEAVSAQVIEPTAMILSTATADCRPSARVVLLKGIDENGLIFFTNYESRKGHNIAENAFVAITFFWPELERQVRIEGLAEKVTEQESDNYYHSRPRGSQIGAWASPQSREITSRRALEEAEAAYQLKFEQLEMIPRPSHWGGYRVLPEKVEFWQGRPNRLHDRICFDRNEDSSWSTNRLAP